MTTILATRPTGPARQAPRVRRAWKRDETELAVRLVASGHSLDEIAIRLGRTVDGVRANGEARVPDESVIVFEKPDLVAPFREHYGPSEGSE